MRIARLTLLCCLCFGPSVFAQTTVSAATAPAQGLKPTLQFPTREAYEKKIGEAGVLLQSPHVWLFAPSRYEKNAKIIFKPLVKAYDELYRIVGVHTKYKIVVYHLPDGFGGTSECTIEYDYKNLVLENSEEWTKHQVPHVSGYIEEMAHNFVSGTHCQFGWEMVGWSLGVKATQRVAPNPIFANSVAATRAEQLRTYTRYKAGNFIFPRELEGNLCVRIHAHLLYQCEQRYGPKFWPDFFAQMRERRQDLAAAARIGDADKNRNARYAITVDCFDRLPRLNFKKLLEANHISTTVDIKALHPTEPGWDRRFEPPTTRSATTTAAQKGRSAK